jgi:hypothetical protein
MADDTFDAVIVGGGTKGGPARWTEHDMVNLLSTGMLRFRPAIPAVDSGLTTITEPAYGLLGLPLDLLTSGPQHRRHPEVKWTR